MTTEEFYAQALLAAFPVAIGRNSEGTRYRREQFMEDLHEHAALLTETFEANRARYHGNQGGSNGPS
jgi:hypothetical protein